MSSNTVIVFGASGKVGSVAARTARALGAQVYLAMRDTAKPIPGLSEDEERAGGIERISADLTQPATLTAAVKTSAARSAFIYSAHGTMDSMRSAIEALRSAGVQFLVFLSSYTITGSPRDVPKEELIPFIHAKVEIAIGEIFGSENYVAIRPGSFATNLLRYKQGIRDGQVTIYRPDIQFDWVDPDDIGAVSGYYLAKRKMPEDSTHVFVHGSVLMSQGDALVAIGNQLGIDVAIEPGTEEEEYDTLVNKAHIPEPVAKYIVEKVVNSRQGQVMLPSDKQLEQGRQAIRYCTEREPGTLSGWVEKNREFFI